jgi:hypothetical protein
MLKVLKRLPILVVALASCVGVREPPNTMNPLGVTTTTVITP